MIDIHCHILPGMDDGPATMDEALEMCRTAASDGIRTIVATPHYTPDSSGWTETGLLAAVASLQDALNKEGIDLAILPGAEMPLFPELPSKVAIGGYLTINRSNYFLLEFSPHAVPPNAEQFLISIVDSGLVPILAHPERNMWFMRNFDILTSLVQRGALLQITTTSLLGEFGEAVRDFSVKLLMNNLVQIIATDAHNSHYRPPLLSDAVALAADLVGREKALSMVTTVPEAVISGNKIPSQPPTGSPAKEQPRSVSWVRRFFGAA